METPHTDLTMSLETQSQAQTRHPLRNKWVLWAHLPQEPADWKTLKGFDKVSKFKTVEDAIAVTESLKEGVVKNCMLFLMKEGINPLWEEPKNRNGGAFSYKVTNKHVLDVWRDLTYLLVGETISTNEKFVNAVTGITISPKKNFCIVKIWITNCDYQNPTIVSNEIRNLPPTGCLFKKHAPEF